MQIIDSFVKRFNTLLEIYRDNGLDMGRYLERLPNAELNSGIQYFLKGYSFDGVSGTQWFSFIKPLSLKIPSHLLWIASYPNINLEYVLDTITEEILLFDVEHDSLEWPCSINHQAFFQSLLIILDNKIEMAQKKSFELDESIILARYEECMIINQYDRRFSTFYEHILGLELNS